MLIACNNQRRTKFQTQQLNQSQITFSTPSPKVLILVSRFPSLFWQEEMTFDTLFTFCSSGLIKSKLHCKKNGRNSDLILICGEFGSMQQSPDIIRYLLEPCIPKFWEVKL